VVEPTPVKNISQIGLFPKVGMKINIFETTRATTTLFKIKPRDYWHIKGRFVLARVYFFKPHHMWFYIEKISKSLFPIPSMYVYLPTSG